MEYHYRFTKEAFWFVMTCVMVAVLPALVTFQPDEITDWRRWAIGIGAAAVRALGGALMALVTKQGTISKS